ncbi:MAG: PEGA domain-containing protein [Myxococcota bacterium]|nr:PEGA domain-containing protein [Myxococcota bacterium]
MSNRDSKDAWAGIVNLDEVPDSSASPENEWEQSEVITQDHPLVDSLPLRVESKRTFDQSQTDKFDLAERTDPAIQAPPNQPRLRVSPIKEKGVDLEAVFNEPNEDTESQAPKIASVSEAFNNASPISNLEETADKSWDPKIKPTWREYKKSLLTGALGVVCIVAVIFIDSTSSDKTEDPLRPSTSANRKLERIERARAGQLPRRPENSETTSPVLQPQKTEQDAAKDAAPEPSADELERTNDADYENVPPPPKAVLPMMSILSEPLGALVEINGKVYGKTPLIRQSPQSKGSLKLRLRFKHYETLNTKVWPNKDGHYEAKLILKRK